MENDKEILSIKVNHIFDKYLFKVYKDKINDNYFIQFKDINSNKWNFVNYNIYSHELILSDTERSYYKNIKEVERIIFLIKNKYENNLEYEYYLF